MVIQVSAVRVTVIDTEFNMLAFFKFIVKYKFFLPHREQCIVYCLSPSQFSPGCVITAYKHCTERVRFGKNISVYQVFTAQGKFDSTGRERSTTSRVETSNIHF